MGDATAKLVKRALQRPPDFGYFGSNKEMFVTWTLGPTIETRDSTLTECSNSQVLERELAAAVEKEEISEDNYDITECKHWACGWVKHLSFKVLGDDGGPTKEWHWVMKWFDQFNDNPVADDIHYLGMVRDATVENIVDASRSCIAERVEEEHDDWPEQMYLWFDEHNGFAIENCDDRGGYPSEEDTKGCLKALGWLNAWIAEDDE